MHIFKRLIGSDSTEKKQATDLEQSKQDKKAVVEKAFKTPLELKGHKNSVISVALSESGSIALSLSKDHEVRVWDLKSGECVNNISDKNVSCIVLSADGTLVFTGGLDGYIWIRNLKTWESKLLGGNIPGIRCIAISRDCSVAISGDIGSTLNVWNLKTRKWVRYLSGHSDYIRCVALSADGNLALSGSRDDTIRVWNVKTGNCVKKISTDSINCITLSADGNLALTGNRYETHVWDLKTEKCVRTLSGHKDHVRSVALSSDGKFALSGSEDHTVRIWNLNTGECEATLNYKTSVYSISSIVQDGNLYVLAGVNSHNLYFRCQVFSPKPSNAKEAKLQSETIIKNKTLDQTLSQQTSDPTPIGNPKIEVAGFIERKGIQERKDIKEARELLDLQGKKEDLETRLTASFKIDYNILKFGKRLGEGGFGIVYQGTKGQEDVAIKQFKIDYISDDAREEFETEVQTMVKLRSKYIVQFYGYCLSPKYSIVMEFMPKGSLTNLLLGKEQLSWELRARMMTEMACGLSVLHTANILHRDIKSLNVLLDHEYHAKISDFGLAKVKTENNISTKDVGGTLRWMAPELLSLSPKHSKLSDVYSLGITFWEIAARKLPYTGAAEAVIKDEVMKGAREQIPADCPKRFATLIQACWDGKEENRPECDTIVAYLKSEQNDFTTFLPSFVASHKDSIRSYVGNLNSDNRSVNSASLTNPSFEHSLLNNQASGIPSKVN